MTHDDTRPRRIAIITEGHSLGAVALAGLIAAGITPVHISEPLDRDDRLMDDLNRVPGPLETSMLDLFRPRRHDEQQRFHNRIHQRLFNPVAAADHVTVTEKPLTKRQRRRMRGKLGATPAKATEARRAETGTGSVHDGAVPQAFAQNITRGETA